MKLPWSSDDKTKVVESLRKREVAEDGSPENDKAAAGGSVDASTEKTLPVESRSRSDSGGKLSWPARDSALLQRGNDRSHQEAHRSASAEEKTRLYVPGASSAESEPAAPAVPSRGALPAKANEDPVVGWLVIIEGPGKGRSFELGYGANSIGRDKNQKVMLDFGDPHISREKHAQLIYDPKSLRFFLQTGDARNLTYVGDEVVLSPVQLTGRESVTVGGTKLVFVPFCGPDFGWS